MTMSYKDRECNERMLWSEGRQQLVGRDRLGEKKDKEERKGETFKFYRLAVANSDL